MNCSMPGFSVYHQLPEFTQTHVHWVGDPSNHLILCHPLPLLPSIFPSIRVFSNESFLCIRWPKDWSFSFNISPSNEHPGLISSKMDWLDLLAVQGTFKGLLQYHSSKASILRHSAFFIVQLSYPYMTTGKTIALTRRTFVGKVMSLLFNMLSSKSLLISWLQSPYAVILKPPHTGEGVEKREPSYTIDENVNCCSHCGKQYGVSFKNPQNKSCYMIRQSHSWACIQKKANNSKRYMHLDTLHSTIHNSQDKETH